MVKKSNGLLVFILLHLLNITIYGQTNFCYANVFDISKLGAQPYGDATQAFTAAWRRACATTTPSKVLIPAGNYFLRPVTFTGPCNSKVMIQVVGNFKAPSDVSQFKDADAWLTIQRVDGLTITAPSGAGVFDGQGQLAWKYNDCDRNPNCHALPYNFRFNFLTNSELSGITSLNSKGFHMAVFGCNQLNMHDITITAPQDSPNTDGVHISRSDGVNVTRFHIGTGDDCVSFGDGTKNVLIEQVTCGPGHGISIGSLGKYPNEEPVQDITVRKCILRSTDNGVRIKTWQNSYRSIVSGLVFENIIVDNVKYPIVIDQEYCPYPHCSDKTPSNVKISNIKFKNIRGTSREKEAEKMVCSSSVPCEEIELYKINIKYTGKDGPAVSTCKNVKPIVVGNQNPPPCTAPPTSTSWGLNNPWDFGRQSSSAVLSSFSSMKDESEGGNAIVRPWEKFSSLVQSRPPAVEKEREKYNDFYSEWDNYSPSNQWRSNSRSSSLIQSNRPLVKEERDEDGFARPRDSFLPPENPWSSNSQSSSLIQSGHPFVKDEITHAAENAVATTSNNPWSSKSQSSSSPLVNKREEDAWSESWTSKNPRSFNTPYLH